MATGVYSNTQTMADDAAHRFETSPKKLRYAYISVATKAMKFGNAAGQYYTVAAGSSIPVTDLDVSKLYFKNDAAGQNGTVTILGTL